MAAAPTSVADVDAGLRSVGYLPGESTALVAFLAAKLGKPVLVEGPAGVGKTELAKALAAYLDRTLVRLQCYEGLDEAKALYEWNYRKQLLRIQAEAEGTGWEDVQDDIFGEEFLLERPLMTAIASPEPVVLLIDEIDKTDQEFEAMLLEVLSDFQISIPELGRVEARTHPVVLLTSNNTRELTEALKRRCLYLWLDYPSLEHELEIVRLHAPELDERVARKLVEVIAMVRDLDLKKPPSIAESIDWARALLLLGAAGHRRATFNDTMSVIVKHRTDLDVVAERVGVQAVEPRSAPEQPVRRAASSSSATSCAARACRSARPRCSTRSPRSSSVGWTDHDVFREALAATLAKSQEDRRVFELVFDRFFFRAAEAAAVREGVREQGDGRAARSTRTAEVDLDALRQQIAAALRDGSEGAMRDLARLAIAAFGRQGEGSGVIGVDVQRIRRALGLRAEPQPDLPRGRPAPRRPAARPAAPLRAAAAPRARARADRAHRGAAAQAPAQRARPRAADRPAPGPRRACTASSRSSSAG